MPKSETHTIYHIIVLYNTWILYLEQPKQPFYIKATFLIQCIYWIYTVHNPFSKSVYMPAIACDIFVMLLFLNLQWNTNESGKANPSWCKPTINISCRINGLLRVKCPAPWKHLLNTIQWEVSYSCYSDSKCLEKRKKLDSCKYII